VIGRDAELERLEAAAERQPLPWTIAMAYRGRGLPAIARSDLTGVFAGLGAQAWRSLAELELGRIGGRTPTGSALTSSERVVAERAAAGRSNKEIAAELMVSTRTVESQLSAVYRKLHVRSRGQLAAALNAE